MNSTEKNNCSEPAPLGRRFLASIYRPILVRRHPWRRVDGALGRSCRVRDRARAAIEGGLRQALRRGRRPLAFLLADHDSTGPWLHPSLSPRSVRYGSELRYRGGAFRQLLVAGFRILAVFRDDASRKRICHALGPVHWNKGRAPAEGAGRPVIDLPDRSLPIKKA